MGTIDASAWIDIRAQTADISVKASVSKGEYDVSALDRPPKRIRMSKT